jgi:hypothetical protein
MPWTVVGPLLCVKHNMQYAWQSMVGDMLNGFSHNDNNFNIIDVRDVAEAQLRIAESADVSNGDRYNLVCHAVRKRSRVGAVFLHEKPSFAKTGSGQTEGNADIKSVFIKNAG